MLVAKVIYCIVKRNKKQEKRGSFSWKSVRFEYENAFTQRFIEFI